jgi:hypothetical protein
MISIYSLNALYQHPNVSKSSELFRLNDQIFMQFIIDEVDNSDKNIGWNLLPGRWNYSMNFHAINASSKSYAP